MALLLARCMSPGLSRLLGLTDIRIRNLAMTSVTPVRN